MCVHNGIFFHFSVYPPLSVTIEIVNDMDANEVTFRFSSNTTEAECTYEDSFSAGRFIYGILPDTEDYDADDFHIYSIGITPNGSGPVTAEPNPPDDEPVKGATPNPSAQPTEEPTSEPTIGMFNGSFPFLKKLKVHEVSLTTSHL